ncbi:lycopene cyclase domain-containing protein [Agromyces sp. CF514]|uniref:lycopene cyclase domain-containing protein n=1 Tax=Agromyces sp. CF514 TaxID=1881031 RepID=UPI0008E07ECE|nr:lycopene cyclase domain-containing protein [Agromyces sp. CF514]SFR79239.1 lycopene cyclase domain-containing protein [Agromyces sp. CF514]
MTYLLICIPFVLVAAITALISLRRMPAPARSRRILATAIGAAVLLVLTAVFDSIMISAGLFGYADGTRLGPTVGLAPVEDFAYPLAAVLLVPAVFTIVAGRRRASRRAQGPRSVGEESS